MTPFKVYWVCLTGPKLGDFKFVSEFFDTEDQARAVVEGYDPRPKGWTDVQAQRKAGENGMYVDLPNARQSRQHELALAESGIVEALAG